MTKPIAVLIADIHYNINTLDIADTALRLAGKKAEELKVPLIVAGDLHDTKALIRGECIKRILNTFDSIKTRKIVIPGNHCMINEKSSDHSLEFLRNSCDLIDRGPYEDPTTELVFLPYHHNLQSLKHDLSIIPKGSTVIAHQGVQGAQMGHYVQDKTSLPKEAWANFRTVSGHYHQRQDIQCGPVKKDQVGVFSYIGNPYTLSFGEAHDPVKGFRILSLDGTLDFVPTNLRHHVIINCHVSELWIFGTQDPSNPLWIKVDGTRSELATVKKDELAKDVGHNNFKLDLIPSQYDKSQEQPKKVFTDVETLDRIIDNLSESSEYKSVLKKLWRDIL